MLLYYISKSFSIIFLLICVIMILKLKGESGMQKNNDYTKPDYVKKRTETLLLSGYPIHISSLDFSKSFIHHTIRHQHDELEFVYSSNANVIIGFDNEELSISDGDIVFINKNVRHIITGSRQENAFSHSILVHPSFIFGLGQLELEEKYLNPIINNSFFNYLHITPDSENYKEYFLYLQQIIELQNKKQTCYELTTKALFLQLWTLLYNQLTLNLNQYSLSNAATQDELRVKQAITFIQNHYNDNITLDDIASASLISKSECCRCFKRVTDLTPFEYLLKYRITESTKRMHEKPYESIFQIACAVGFNNTSYYNKIFKKYMNCTPTQYRKSIKDGNVL